MYWIPVILILPYIILLLKIYRGLCKVRIFSETDHPAIFVSVVVACRNEQKNLPALLNGIALQNYPANLFEVIIVNDKSTDKTFEFASGFAGIKNIIILDNNGEGKKQALRTGILSSRGKLIITTDADCTMGKDWIRTIAAFYEINSPDMIICPVMIKSARGFFGRFRELEFLSLQGITAGTALSGEATMCNGANLAFTKQAYLNHSGELHDEINSGDDVFLLHGLKKEVQARILWLESSEALVITESPSAVGAYLKQRTRWISKIKAYNDSETTLLGIVTFVAIILQLSYFAGVFINPAFTPVFLSVLILKSVPDFLILLNTSARYGIRKLMRWFLPAQLIYPFYVLSVVFSSLLSWEK